MKSMTWMLIAVYVLLGLMLLLLPTMGPEPWQIYVAMPIIGAIIQLIAESRGFRVAGFLMTLVGLVIVILILKDDAKWHERAMKTKWEAEKRAEQSAAPLPSAPAGPSEGAR